MRLRNSFLVLLIAILVSGTWGWSASTTLVSVDSAGAQGTADSDYLSISADGRYVVFETTNALVPEDVNGATDVYLRDTLLGVTELVSVNSAEEPGSDASWPSSWSGVSQAISADGRFVVFASQASSFGAPGSSSCFVRDRVLGVTEVVDLGPAGEGADFWTPYAAISADGRFVAMLSTATNLVPGGTTQQFEVFVRDRLLGVTELVSVDITGAEGDNTCWPPTLVISSTGRYVAFSSLAHLAPPYDESTGEAQVYLRDREAGTTEKISVSSLGKVSNHEGEPVAITPDGRFVAFYTMGSSLSAGNVNYYGRYYLRDRVQGTTQRIASSAQDWNGGLSEDARFVLFETFDQDLIGAFSDGEIHSESFVWDRVTHGLECVTVDNAGVQGDYRSCRSVMSADGRYVAFASDSDNLVTPDTNGRTYDIFLRDRGPLPPAPRAGFVMVPAYSTIGSPVSFQDLSPVTPTSTPMAWLWDFGDGDQSTAQNPTHSYAWAGDYPISLTVTFEDESDETSNVGGSVVITFPDVSLDHWAAQHILACIKAHLILGYPDGQYKPALVVARDQIAVYVARMVAGGDEHVPTGPAVPTFPDVPTDFWAYKYIEYARDNGIVTGYPEGDYRPTQPLDRAQMAVFAARATATPIGEAGLADYVPWPGGTFTDVPRDHWAYKYVEYCWEHGLLTGYGDGSYHPQDSLTRDQMAVYIARMLDLP